MGLRKKKLIGHTIWYICMFGLAYVTIYPVIYALLGSLKTNTELMTGGGIFPEVYQWQNYMDIWNSGNFARYTFNSLYMCFFCVLFAILLSTLTAYCIARHEFPLKKLIYATYLGTMFISLGAVTLRPLYLLAIDVGIFGTLWPIIFILVGSQGVNIFLVTRFVGSIPRELDESATLDGCGPMGIYWRIILPLLKPIIGVVALFQFRHTWNDYITSSVFTMTASELRPLTVGVVMLKYSVSAAAEWHLMMAGAAVAIVPMLIVYAVCNKQFMSGLTEGSVKG